MKRASLSRWKIAARFPSSMTDVSRPAARSLVGLTLVGLVLAGSLVSPAHGDERAPIPLPNQEQFAGYRDASTYVTLSPEADRLSVWEFGAPRPRLTIRGEFGGRNEAYAGDAAVFFSQPSRIAVWSLRTGKLLVDLRPANETIRAFQLSPDGQRLAYEFTDGQVQFKLIGLPDGEPVAIIPAAGRHDDCQNGDWGLCLAFSPDGRLLVTSSRETATIADAATGRVRRVLEGHRNQVERAIFSADGKRLATVGCDGTILVWDVAGGHLLATLKSGAMFADGATNGSFDVSSDGGRVVYSDFSRVVVWSVDKRKRLFEGKGHGGPNRASFRLTPDGRKLLEIGEELFVWDLTQPSEKPLASLGAGPWFDASPYLRWILRDRPGDAAVPMELVPLDLAEDAK